MEDSKTEIAQYFSVNINSISTLVPVPRDDYFSSLFALCKKFLISC